jgi:hypothetical protein
MQKGENKMSIATFNIPKTAIIAKEWKRINTCCGPVERIEWAEGRFIYRCSKCRRTRAMEKNGIVTWKEEMETIKL